MSLISDPDFLIHSLRLSYLRNVEDPYGSRIISLNPHYISNPYILAASLADVERWPELAMPSSPPPSDDENESSSRSINASGFPASGLNYTRTIMGPSRSGGMGLRVSGTRRSSTISKRNTGTSHLSPAILVKDAPVIQEQAPSQPDERPPVALPKEVQFIPKFKGAAEMEARRKLRIQARQAPVPEPKPVVASVLNPEMSSSEGSLDIEEDEDDDFEVIGGGEDSMDEDDDDEFDPDFAATRTSGVYFEMVTAPPKNNEEAPPPRRKSENISKSSVPLSSTTSSSSSDITFTRRKVLPARSGKSALTAMLASSGGSSNPFTELYAAMSGRAETASTNVRVYFPHARQPSGRPMDLNVRKDASVEEVIGFALWNYWEEGWLPKLEEGLGGDEDPKRAVRLSAIGWIMHIAEDDGEVDDDYPLPDRTSKISKFSFDAYAILEAAPDKVQENQVLEAKIQRRPSRIMVASKKPETLSVGGLAPPSTIPGPGTSAMYGSTLGSLPLSTSLGSSSQGPQLFLRIRVADTTDVVHVSSTIPVSAGMYIQDALEKVCEKRKLDPKEFALLLGGDKSIFIPLDRTVASLQGQRDLILVNRSVLPQLGIDVVKTSQRTTDPNASIFKRISEVPTSQFTSSAMDFTTAYKKYTIYRKMPMLVTRLERTLAIDGVYIHIMPSTNKAKVFDSGRTSSYHIQSIVQCQQSIKSSSIFKLIVARDSRHKRYDFEAESPKLASEIVYTIRSMKAVLERNGSAAKARRSKVAA